MTNSNTCISCGASGQNWDGEGRCISCARDKVLGTDTPEFETVDEAITNLTNRKLIHEDRWDDLKRSLKQSMWLIFDSVDTGHSLDCADETDIDSCSCGYISRRQRLDQALTKYFGEE